MTGLLIHSPTGTHLPFAPRLQLRFGAGESSHVAHLKHRPKQYLAALLPFLRKAFSRKRS